MVKISSIFLQRSIDTVCCLAQMYKVELRAGLNNRWQSNSGHFGRGFFMLLWSPAIHLSGFLSHSLFAPLIPPGAYKGW